MGLLRSLPQEKTDANPGGRWSYISYLGEGGLARVYRVADARDGNRQVALKVLRAHARAAHAFELHREAQWSLQLLHNAKHKDYSARGAERFAQYFEDHSGMSSVKNYPYRGSRNSQDTPDAEALLEELRHCQNGSFSWAACREAWSERPHVVLEALPGESLHQVLSSASSSSSSSSSLLLAPSAGESDSRSGARGRGHLRSRDAYHILVQVAEGCHYLHAFRLIHRDIRPCNIQLLGTGAAGDRGDRADRGGGGGLGVKILDLGVMILAEEENRINMNESVHVFEADRIATGGYDWLPWEVRPGLVNFAWPRHAFDCFSLGVLWLQLLQGLRPASATLAALSKGSVSPNALDPTLEQMLSAAEVRPPPQEYLKRLRGLLAAAPSGTADSLKSVAADLPMRTRKVTRLLEKATTFPRGSRKTKLLEKAQPRPTSAGPLGLGRGLASRTEGTRAVAGLETELEQQRQRQQLQLQLQQQQQQQQQQQGRQQPGSQSGIIATNNNSKKSDNSCKNHSNNNNDNNNNSTNRQATSSSKRKASAQTSGENAGPFFKSVPCKVAAARQDPWNASPGHHRNMDWEAFAQRCEAAVDEIGREGSVLELGFLREGLSRMVADLEDYLSRGEDSEVLHLLQSARSCYQDAKAVTA